MKNEEALIVTDDQTRHFPAIVEAEKMLDKFTDVCREIGRRAYHLFLDRGGDPGYEVDDWVQAEMKTLRSAPAKITETAEEVHVRIAAPGFKPNEVELCIKDQILYVSGETTSEKTAEDEHVFYNEWQSDSFIRELALPSPVETDKIEPLLENGVLMLTLKKKHVHGAAKGAVNAA